MNSLFIIFFGLVLLDSISSTTARGPQENVWSVWDGYQERPPPPSGRWVVRRGQQVWMPYGTPPPPQGQPPPPPITLRSPSKKGLGSYRITTSQRKAAGAAPTWYVYKVDRLSPLQSLVSKVQTSRLSPLQSIVHEVRSKQSMSERTKGNDRPIQPIAVKNTAENGTGYRNRASSKSKTSDRATKQGRNRIRNFQRGKLSIGSKISKDTAKQEGMRNRNFNSRNSSTRITRPSESSRRSYASGRRTYGRGANTQGGSDYYMESEGQRGVGTGQGYIFTRDYGDSSEEYDR